MVRSNVPALVLEENQVARRWRFFVQGKMSPRFVIAAKITLGDPPQMPTIYEDNGAVWGNLVAVSGQQSRVTKPETESFLEVA
jgi:hypothetical protein